MEIEYKVDGEMIRSIREKRNLDGKDVAAMIGVTPNYFYMVERNEKTPAFPLLMKIAGILEIPVGILLENGHGGKPGIFKVGILEFDVAPELVEPIIKIIELYNAKR